MTYGRKIAAQRMDGIDRTAVAVGGDIRRCDVEKAHCEDPKLGGASKVIGSGTTAKRRPLGARDLQQPIKPWGKKGERNDEYAERGQASA